MKTKLVHLQTLISKEIQYMLTKEQYKAGDRLPSERVLAERFSVQRQTVRSALLLLERKGIILSKDRSGHYMAEGRLPVCLNQFIDPETLLGKNNDSLSRKVLDFEKTRISKNLMYKMHIQEETEIYRIIQLWSIHDEPKCLERSYILSKYLSSLKENDLQTQSRYQILPFAYMDQRMEIIHAEKLEAELMRVPVLEPLIQFSGFTFNEKNECVEYFERVTVTDSHIFYC